MSDWSVAGTRPISEWDVVSTAPDAAAPQPGVPQPIPVPQAQAMTRPGWKPEPAPREVGGLEAMLRTVGEAARVAVGQATMANAALARVFGQSAQDAAFRTHEQIQESMRGAYAPKPNERFGILPSLAGGIVSMPMEVVGGMGMQHGTERAQEVMQRGGTLAEAQRAGGVTGAVRTALNLLPAKAGGAVGRAIESKVGGALGGAATGGAIATAANPAGRAVENAALPEGEQFQGLRQDVAPSAAEVGMGMAFGAVPGAAAAGSAALKQRKAKAAALERPELEGVRKAHDAGYWLTPEAAKAGATARGVAIAAGRKSVARHMARHNEENTARLVRQDVGLPEDVPITQEALATVRKEAGEAYGVLERYGEFETDPQLHSDISGITAQARKIAEEFPTLLDSPLLDHAAAVDVPKMTTTGAIAVVRDLRNKADKAMRGEKPDRALASAYRALANAVDSSMERALAKRVANESPKAQAAFDAYRAARTRIAKAHLAEDALTGVPGEVDSAAYAKADEKLGGKMTGPGKEIADFHKQFAKQGLAKAPKAPPGEWFHEWRIGALLHAPFTIGGAIATRLGAQHGLGTDLAQQAITRRARAATAEPPGGWDLPPPDLGPRPLERAPEGPLPPRPAGEAPASPLGDLTPDWETAPGAAPAGPPAELAPTEAVGGAMQGADATLARRQQEAARLAAETQSPEVQRVLAEHARKLERQAAAEAAKQKRLQDAAELRRVAAQTADPEIQQALHARAVTLEAAEPVPAGKVKEGAPAPKAATAKAEKPVPVGEVTEIAAEVVEPALVAAPAVPEPVTRPPRTEPRVGKAGPKDKFVVGRVYRDSQGNMAIRQADGSWKEIK